MSLSEWIFLLLSFLATQFEKGGRLGLYIWAILVSVIKYFIGLGFMFFHKFNFFEMWICGALGCMIATVISTYVGEWIILGMKNPHFREKFHRFKFWKSKPMPFRRRRKIHIYWRKYGIYGVAALTPILFMPPLAVGIALSFREDKKNILTFFCIAELIWTLILAIFFPYLRDFF